MREHLAAFLVGALLLIAPMAGATHVHAGSDAEPSPPVTINEFFPTDRSLGECLSALPKPGCGSEARGGMHQTVLFGALVLGLGVIGTRIAFAIRRRDTALAASPGPGPGDADPSDADPSDADPSDGDGGSARAPSRQPELTTPGTDPARTADDG